MSQNKLSKQKFNETNEKIMSEAVEQIIEETTTRITHDEITYKYIKKALEETYGKENITPEMIKQNLVEYYIWRRATRYENENTNA